MCCGCPVNITRLMEDCYGLMGLKVNVDCFKLFHCIVRTGVYGIPCPAEGTLVITLKSSTGP